MTITPTEHGARPVPVPSEVTQFNLVPPPDAQRVLRPAEPRETVHELPDDHDSMLDLARQPLRRGALVPVVGWEGGAGRTTITRLLAGTFVRVRGNDPVIVDAVPMWGALTASADNPGEYSPGDVAAMSWPLPRSVIPRLMTTIDGIPLLAGATPVRGMRTDAPATFAAVRRIASLARLTFIDTVADAGGALSSELISDTASAVVWVSSATRAGLWGIAEALTYYRAVGAQLVASRSVVAIVGGARRWPSDAAAAEAQLTGLGVETVRFPRSAKPLADAGCRASAERLLAAVVARSR